MSQEDNGSGREPFLKHIKKCARIHSLPSQAKPSPPYMQLVMKRKGYNCFVYVCTLCKFAMKRAGVRKKGRRTRLSLASTAGCHCSQLNERKESFSPLSLAHEAWLLPPKNLRKETSWGFLGGINPIGNLEEIKREVIQHCSLYRICINPDRTNHNQKVSKK